MQVEEDRRPQVEAAIVRVLKARRLLDHNSIVAQVAPLPCLKTVSRCPAWQTRCHAVFPCSCPAAWLRPAGPLHCTIQRNVPAECPMRSIVFCLTPCWSIVLHSACVMCRALLLSFMGM